VTSSMQLAIVVLSAIASASASASAWGAFGPTLGDGAPSAVTDGPARVVHGAL